MTEVENRIKKIKNRPYFEECTNGILKEILIELIILNSKIEELKK